MDRHSRVHEHALRRTRDPRRPAGRAGHGRRFPARGILADVRGQGPGRARHLGQSQRRSPGLLAQHRRPRRRLGRRPARRRRRAPLRRQRLHRDPRRQVAAPAAADRRGVGEARRLARGVQVHRLQGRRRLRGRVLRPVLVLQRRDRLLRLRRQEVVPVAVGEREGLGRQVAPLRRHVRRQEGAPVRRRRRGRHRDRLHRQDQVRLAGRRRRHRRVPRRLQADAQRHRRRGADLDGGAAGRRGSGR